MGLSSKFGKHPKFPTAGHYINPNRQSIHLTKFPFPCSGKSAVVLGDNSLHPPLEVLSLLLSSHQRRFWISWSEIGYESVLSDLCSGNKRRSKLQTIEMPIKERPLSTKIKPKVWYACVPVYPWFIVNKHHVTGNQFRLMNKKCQHSHCCSLVLA